MRFREAVTRMESLMEEEAKDSVSAIKSLRDKATLAKERCARCDPIPNHSTMLIWSCSCPTSLDGDFLLAESSWRRKEQA